MAINSYDKLVEKWSPVLDEEAAGKIDNAHKRSITAVVLENTEKALREQGQLTEVAANAAADGTVSGGGAAEKHIRQITILNNLKKRLFKRRRKNRFFDRCRTILFYPEEVFHLFLWIRWSRSRLFSISCLILLIGFYHLNHLYGLIS